MKNLRNKIVFDLLFILSIIFGLYLNILVAKMLFWILYCVFVMAGLFVLRITYSSFFKNDEKLVRHFASNKRGIYNTCYDATVAILMVLFCHFVVGFIWFAISELMKHRIKQITALHFKNNTITD